MLLHLHCFIARKLHTATLLIQLQVPITLSLEKNPGSKNAWEDTAVPPTLRQRTHFGPVGRNGGEGKTIATQILE
ncbi:hypothetical protein IscW_ISCW000027 [Ixodes scapularis]|uniref:Secreted protein n=1 Tax=Ixodes scapularis TaxID=6945 RepID=B7P1V9_IXOSC|nr:hypothetical protein IscW_ISCW000027 [Ixodes scapularis]|eukprot:XP_002433517.1 hypothetical protein IscW_ISCW000027 [Ixodes scapularis]